MAGTRKSGNEMTGLCDNLKRHARLLVAAMLMLWDSVALEHFKVPRMKD
jgi:hypothetical protein